MTPLIKRFRFKPADGSALPTFSGGAHVVVEMQDGETLRRNPYSLMSPPTQTSSYTISVRRDEAGRGGSRFLHDTVHEGAELLISHPVNLFAIDQRAKKHILFAGGIGITPFLAMMAAALQRESQLRAPLCRSIDGTRRLCRGTRRALRQAHPHLLRR